MSNECQRVITLTENRRILQIEENISISRQTLTYAGRGMVSVHILPESQYPGRYRESYTQTSSIKGKTAPSQTGSIEKP